MGMFSRISDIVQSNINALLDKAEDPEKVIKLIIEEMQETLVEVRSIAARQIADKKQLERQVEKLQSQRDEWASKAEKAMIAGREDLARGALEQKHSAETKLISLQDELSLLAEQLDKLQEDAQSLQNKIGEAKAKQKSLYERQRIVGARYKTKQQNEKMNVDEVLGRFDHYERKIDELEAKVEAFDIGGTGKDLSAQFKELETNEAIDAELAELKKKVA